MSILDVWLVQVWLRCGWIRCNGLSAAVAAGRVLVSGRSDHMVTRQIWRCAPSSLWDAWEVSDAHGEMRDSAAACRSGRTERGLAVSSTGTVRRTVCRRVGVWPAGRRTAPGLRRACCMYRFAARHIHDKIRIHSFPSALQCPMGKTAARTEAERCALRTDEPTCRRSNRALSMLD